MVYALQMKKQNKTATILVNFEESHKKQLEREAQALGLKLGSYVRSLVLTHPDRKK